MQAGSIDLRPPIFSAHEEDRQNFNGEKSNGSSTEIDKGITLLRIDAQKLPLWECPCSLRMIVDKS